MQEIQQALLETRAEIGGKKFQCLLEFYLSGVKEEQTNVNVSWREYRTILASPRALLEHQLVTAKLACALDVLRDFAGDVYSYWGARDKVRLLA